MEKFKQVVERYVGHPVILSDSFEQYDIDSLATVEFIMDLEDEYDISIDDAAASQFKTFQDAYNYIEHAMQMKNCRWRVGQTLVNRREDVPYIVTKVSEDSIQLTRIVTVKPSEFEEWCDGQQV